MYDILELNKKLSTELKEIAKTLNLKRVNSLSKEDLIYKILDQQALENANNKEENKYKGKSNQPKIAANKDTKNKPSLVKEKEPTKKTKEPAKKVETFTKPKMETTISEKNSNPEHKKPSLKKEQIDYSESKQIRHPKTDNLNNNDQKKRSEKEQRIRNAMTIETEGVIDVMSDGYGFLRSSDYNYMSSPDDVYISQSQVKKYGFKTGDTIKGIVRLPREKEKYFPLVDIKLINNKSPQLVRDRVPFDYLTPVFPFKKLDLINKKTNSLSNRVVDLFTPIGKGQRGLIVSQPKTGKTTLLKDLANSISENHPEIYLIILLIDERPEEVTDMSRSVNAEVVASTFDEPAEKHVKLSNLVLEKAKRMVECGHDVVILLDSITRLARAFNTVLPSSGKVLSGGVDANALHKPKRFFGAARQIEDGGSLTIIATALTETGSKMDDVIFEEFKGTGNMELQLERKISNKRIYPAIDIIQSSTRKEELLLGKDITQKMWILRRFISDMSPVEAMEFLQGRMSQTRNNSEFLTSMNG